MHSKIIKVVILQPMYFPWLGLLEQVNLANIFVFLDDVQLPSKRSFISQVQTKGSRGNEWLRIPYDRPNIRSLINEIPICYKKDWKSQHKDILRKNYQNSPYYQEMIYLVEEVFSKPHSNLSDLLKNSILVLVRYFDLAKDTKFMNSSDMNISSKNSERLLSICKSVSANTYITGHGAKNYLDHNIFEQNNIKVEYMKYELNSYAQQNGKFTPYVSALDLVANCGRLGAKIICSKSIYWKDFINEK